MLKHLAAALILLAATQAEAKLKVVTTLPSFADLAARVGGEDVDAVSLLRGNQDPHFVDPKPDLILQINKTDLLIRAGLGLEDGWLPPLVLGSRNAKVRSGGEGDLDASTLVTLLEVPEGKVDRSMGDVHPGGNPHYMLDPRNGLKVAKAIAERLSKLDASKAPEYEKRYAELEKELQAKIAVWQKQLKPLLGGKPVVTYHRSFAYLTAFTGMIEAGYVEPKPGIPPSPDHVVKLGALMKERKVALILIEAYYPKSIAEQLAQTAKATLVTVPTEPGAFPHVKTYFDVFDDLIKRLTPAPAKK